ncbi:phage tail protein I [Methylobacterium aquaticum]|uniref:phage tail protein I n=1 Tax=Methylobacterium aquaticum TaxID=270351 RepID=UPI0019341968|nr:phage tail protein I [Methylobacterium aquaticum]QRE74380.1 phage tail protein I [Methylobacterium aquaticum]
MSRRPERDALLPDRALPLERAISKTEGRLEDIDADRIRRSRSIDDADAAELAHLAAWHSVDVYDPAWPIAIRREVVRAAPLVHAYKGTPFAIKAALAALRVEARLTEWWQTEPKGTPYTFEVEAIARSRLYPDGPFLGPRTIRVVYDTVMRSKADTRAFDLRVGVGMEVDLGLAPVSTAQTRLTGIAASRLPVPPARSVLGLAPAVVAGPRLACPAVARLPVPGARAALGLAPAATAMVRISLAAVTELRP